MNAYDHKSFDSIDEHQKYSVVDLLGGTYSKNDSEWYFDLISSTWTKYLREHSI